ncbi:SMC-Scp complex subunit ScpB [Limosilactobacillus oris]|uniref:SMC-Scp complex subunit ScpB n=1 Tax=Limosilactobacillus oris TaxID=1632 RepID=UPI00388D0B4D
MTKIQASNLAQVEGLLFISGDEGITLGNLAKITGFMKPALREMLAALQAKYAQDQDSALILLQSADTYRLATKQALAPVIKHFFEVPLTVPLTTALLETLAIIAYRQPITRLEIDSIRGVQSSGGIQKLMVRGLIDTKGRLDAPGRPFLYITTDNFLNYFGLTTLDELPALPKQADADDGALSGDLFLTALQSWERHEEDE